jgi:hypothetical protein
VRIFVHAGTAVDKVGSGLQEIHSARLGAVHALPETVAPVVCPRDKPPISRRGSLLPEADEHLSLCERQFTVAPSSSGDSDSVVRTADKPVPR